MEISSSTMSDHDMAWKFEQRYQNWKSYIAGPVMMESSSDANYINNAEFRELVALGPEALPFFIDKLENDPEAHFLVHALPQLTGKTFSADEVAAAAAQQGVPLGNQGYARMWIDWWKREKEG